MAQRVRVLTALAEDLGLIPSTLCGGSQLPVPPVPGNLMFSDLCGFLNTYGSHKFIWTHNTHK